MKGRRSLSTACVLLLLGLSGRTAGQPLASPVNWVPLFDGKSLNGWKETPFFRKGEVHLEDATIVLGRGRMTGISWTGEFPRSNYEIRFEAARLDGNDFFAGITFPVGDSHCSWINGGWDGTVVGLSTLEGDDASENDTSTNRDFARGRWYAFRLQVTEQRIQAWIDDALVIDTDIRGRQVGLMLGESELSVPLGFASYATKAGLRKIEYRRVSAEHRE